MPAVDATTAHMSLYSQSKSQCLRHAIQLASNLSSVSTHAVIWLVSQCFRNVGNSNFALSVRNFAKVQSLFKMQISATIYIELQIKNTRKREAGVSVQSMQFTLRCRRGERAMEPRTTSVEGEASLVQAGNEVGVQVGFHASEKPSTYQATALMPRSGGELVQDFQPGIAGALIAGGFTLCMVAAIMRHRR